MVSLMAIVPERECRMPTLMVSLGLGQPAEGYPEGQQHARDTQFLVFQVVLLLCFQLYASL